MAVLNGFSVRRADFLNNETYDEVRHASVMENAIPNSAYYGFEYDEETSTITNGRGIVGGLPIRLGRDNESVQLPLNYTGLIQIRVELNGSNTQTYIETTTTEMAETDTTKTFVIYELENGLIINDLRMQNWVNDVDFEQDENGLFFITINGKKTDPIEIASVTGNSYSKEESDEKYATKEESDEKYATKEEIFNNEIIFIPTNGAIFVEGDILTTFTQSPYELGYRGIEVTGENGYVMTGEIIKTSSTLDALFTRSYIIGSGGNQGYLHQTARLVFSSDYSKITYVGASNSSTRATLGTSFTSRIKVTQIKFTTI